MACPSVAAKRIQGSGQKAGFWKGFFFAAVFVLAIFLFLPVRYESNDDFALVTNLGDRSWSSAEPLHPALGCSMGWLLYFLYRHVPGVPWYGTFVISAAFFGTVLILAVLFRSAQGFSMLLALPLLCMLFFHIFSFVSFTSASLILELGVFLCLLEWVARGRCPAKNARCYAFTLAVGFLISSLLRWRVVAVSVLFGTPVLLFLSKDQRRKAIPFLAAMALVFVGDRALFHFTSSEEYKAFWAYNQLRAGFHDTTKGEYHGTGTWQALNKVGWSMEDYVFYRNWIVYDNTRFNTNTLRTFLKENETQQEDPFLRKVQKRLQGQFRIGYHYILALTFSIVSLWVYRLDGFWALPKAIKWRILLSLAVIGTGILGVMYTRSVPRVYIPLFAYVFAATFVLFHPRREVEAHPRRGTFRRTVAVVLAFLFSLLTWGQAYAQGKRDFDILERSRLKKEYIRKQLEVVRKEGAVADPLLILMEPREGLGIQYIHPLKEFSDFADVRIFPAGWGINSPRYSSMLRGMGLQDGRAFLKWLIDKEGVLLVLMAQDGREVWRSRTLWESYLSRRIAENREVRLVVVHDFRNPKGEGLVFFRAESRK
jgi:hypothetical protein